MTTNYTRILRREIMECIHRTHVAVYNIPQNIPALAATGDGKKKKGSEFRKATPEMYAMQFN